MTRSIVWFEREFKFDLPVWMYPNIIERLRGTPARLEDRFGPLSAEALTRRDGERWLMQEHAGHLLDLEPLEMQRLEDYLAGRETLQAADLQNRRTSEAQYNSQDITKILRSFRDERLAFVRSLEELDDDFILRTALHPRLKKPMRVLDLAFFKAEHDDHHLARISELIGLFARQ